MNRIALALARRFGHRPAWAIARRIVDRAQLQLIDVSLFLHDFDGQRIAREAIREKEKEEAGRQALSELDALLSRLAAEEKAKTTPVPPPADAERLREAGRVLGQKIIDDVRLRSSTGKPGRN